MKRKVTVKISKVFIIAVAFLFFVIVIRLAYISLSKTIDGVNLHDFAENRNTTTDIVIAKRGNIYDYYGNTLASVVNSYTIFAYLDESRTSNPNKPQHVVDIAKTAQMLNELLGIDYEYAVKQLTQDKYQVYFGSKGKGISESLKNKIIELKMPGIDFELGQKRTYNMGEFASYIIGYAKVTEDEEVTDIKGELGIESYYNEELSGTDGSITYQTDAYGYQLPSAEPVEEKAIDGNDIYLTLDSNIQIFVENITSNLAKKYDMDWMVFSVMDAKTGAIVASSTYPNFDPNDLNTLSSYMNPLVSYEYEPGSTMKIFSFASSIEEGLYNGSELFKSGHIEVGGYTIKDFNKTGWGLIDYDTGFAYSSNVAATNLALELGADKLKDYYKNLGFGSKTGIELANEVKGKIKFQYQSEIATASFGQGITVTPIQMLQALSVLTNDGVMIKPYIVDKIVDSDGNSVYEGKRTEIKKVYSKETMDYVKGLMHNVVYDGLASTKYWQPSKTTIIGKTGTAQIASPNGGYLTGGNDYIRSFAGVFPEENPEYIVYIATKRINTSATNVAKEFSKTIDDIASYLGLQNNKETIETKIISLDNYISAGIKETLEELKELKLTPIVIGDGKYVINQYPLKKSKVLEGGKIFLMTNSDNYVMEDMTNWSLNEVMTYANLLNIKVVTTGSGYVKNQSVSKGTPITDDLTIYVSFE